MTRPLITLLCVLLLVTVSEMKVQAQVAEQDSLALVALYNATDGPNWTVNTNWLTGPVASWSAVTVTGDRVTSLSLVVNRLTGRIPEEVGNLTNLSFLFLSQNQLTGPIPETLGNLTTWPVGWHLIAWQTGGCCERGHSKTSGFNRRPAMLAVPSVQRLQSGTSIWTSHAPQAAQMPCTAHI